MSETGELVLGVPREGALRQGSWRGIREGPSLAGQVVDLERMASFRRRAEAEEDPGWKQLIPYLALRDGAAVFLMRRTRAGGDPRLHDRYSIGVGGHVNPGDDGLLGGLRREWREELATDFEPEFTLLGLLNDDDDPVGAVHLGIVYAADARGRPVSVRETDKLSGAFVPLPDVERVYRHLETWSQLLFDHLCSRS